ncbi:uncharacterized protein THITE_113550 [Thermothielavioides terrestris NRRL 8126]|uniref:Uncharacterized protein n=1 Tax=Thermothielavioides terrestris (strain ATCC 38088 / NRRL 8126) TaxID=578455 RepID=G2RA94_THETT|nr:uncharacterized protein THITE_113550 [Thermothielavioides terrestris NRRL 8126]AEO68826.1 hypothetical protein THITE_113550 [Thermothielavioides terrestris NRRL 8126]
MVPAAPGCSDRPILLIGASACRLHGESWDQLRFGSQGTVETGRWTLVHQLLSDPSQRIRPLDSGLDLIMSPGNGPPAGVGLLSAGSDLDGNRDLEVFSIPLWSTFSSSVISVVNQSPTQQLNAIDPTYRGIPEQGRWMHLQFSFASSDRWETVQNKSREMRIARKSWSVCAS